MIMRWGLAGLVCLIALGSGLAEAQEWNTLQNTATPGNGAELDVNGYHSVSIVVQMASTGTVQFKVKGDGNYTNLGCTDLSDAAGGLVTSVTASKNLVCSTGGMAKIQVPITAAGGNITVKAKVSNVIVSRGGGSTGGGSGVSVAEDIAHVNGENVVPMGCRRIDTAASSATSSGNWATLDCDSIGRLRVLPAWLTPNGDTLIDDTNDALRVTGTTVQAVSGNVAHDAADAQSPVVIGGHASASVLGETVVQDQDAVRWHFGRDGVPHVRTGCPLEDIVSAVVTATSGANTSGISAQGAGIKVYLSQVIIYNNGSSNGSMIVTDGSGGTTKLKLPFPALTGTTVMLPLPIGFSANTAIFVDPSGSDNIDVTLIGCKSKL